MVNLTTKPIPCGPFLTNCSCGERDIKNDSIRNLRQKFTDIFLFSEKQPEKAAFAGNKVVDEMNPGHSKFL